MFLRNWSIERIQQEVAWVYHNTVKKGVGLNSINQELKRYKFKENNGNFDIVIEIDDLGNIYNAHPLI
jgi:hypothetical protein